MRAWARAWQTIGGLIDIAQGYQDRKLEGLSCVVFYIHRSTPCAPFPHSHAIYLLTNFVVKKCIREIKKRNPNLMTMLHKRILYYLEYLKKASHSRPPMDVCSQALLTLSKFLLSSDRFISVTVMASISAGTRSCKSRAGTKGSQYPGAGVPLEDCQCLLVHFPY
jgi:hypothetical protein